MGSSKDAKPAGGTSSGGFCPATTPGPLGMRDRADPNVFSWFGDSPGPLGINDHGQPNLSSTLKAASSYHVTPAPIMLTQATPPQTPSQSQSSADETTISGSVPAGGIPSIIRIPVPGTNGLFISVTPRGWIPEGGSTCSIFIQDINGKRHLRLDYSYNKVSKKIDYHWNQRGTNAKFGISQHDPAGSSVKALFKGAKCFKYAGRTLLVVGVVMDFYSLCVAKNFKRQVVKVVSGWGGATAGASALGTLGAEIGSVEPGFGTMVGGLVLGIIGGAGGYFGASWAAGEAYDWVDETYFEEIPESAAPN